MTRERVNGPYYEQLKDTIYLIDFVKIFESPDGQYMVQLLVDEVKQRAGDVNLTVGHYNHHFNPRPEQRNIGLAGRVGRTLDLPYATITEYLLRPPHIDQKIQKGSHAVLVEPAVRTGETLMRCANLLRSKGVSVTDTFVYMTWPEGDKKEELLDKLRHDGINLYSIASAREVLDGLRKKGMLTQEEYDKALTDENFR